MEEGEAPKLERKLSPLEVIEQAIKEEEEKRMGIWTKLYEGLSEADQDNLLKSASSLINKFITQNPRELPDIIILPEISARPLYYLLNPAIKAISEKRQVKTPTFIYFQAHKGSEMSLIDEEGREKMLTPVKELKKMMEFSTGSNPMLQGYLQSEIELRENGPVKAQKLRDLMQKRADEVMDYLRKVGIVDPNIVIFDDYVTKLHSSIDEVRLAFGSNIPAYCLLQDRGVVFPESIQIFTGMDDPYGTTEIANSQGFEYRSKHEGNRHAIGVEKADDSMYVKNSQARNAASMQNLRKGLQIIGQQVLQRLPDLVSSL